MKKAKFVATLVIGLLLSFAAMWIRGLFDAESVDEIVMAISDGFTVAGLLYLCLGALMWVSTTGFFDIFGYAFKKAAHALFPGMVDNTSANYYDYKVGKLGKRKGFSQHSALVIGAGFIVISFILTMVWYSISA